MILYSCENDECKRIQAFDPNQCLNRCDDCYVAIHAYPSGNIISIGSVTPDERGRVKGIIVRLCPNPNTCPNVDRRFPAKEQIRRLLEQKN